MAEDEGWVYFMMCMGGSLPIKIGFSMKPTRRRRDLQRQSPYPIKLLYAMPGSRKTEKELHRRFGEYRLYGRREWFSLGLHLQTYLSDLGVNPALTSSEIAAMSAIDVPHQMGWRSPVMLEKEAMCIDNFILEYFQMICHDGEQCAACPNEDCPGEEADRLIIRLDDFLRTNETWVAALGIGAPPSAINICCSPLACRKMPTIFMAAEAIRAGVKCLPGRQAPFCEYFALSDDWSDMDEYVHLHKCHDIDCGDEAGTHPVGCSYACGHTNDWGEQILLLPVNESGLVCLNPTQ